MQENINKSMHIIHVQIRLSKTVLTLWEGLTVCEMSLSRLRLFLSYIETNEALLRSRRDATADYYLLNVPWMDDWWFILSLSSNNHTDERAKISRAPHRGLWQWCPSPVRGTWQQIYLVEAFTFCTFTHDQYAENKVFSHSESSLNDIVVV